MEEVRFFVTVGDDQIIRLPAGITLPGGEVEVIIRAPAALDDSDLLASTRAMLLAIAADAEATVPPMPSDMAENHDYYAHGKPRP